MDMKTQQYIRELDDLWNTIKSIDDEEIKSSLVKLFCIRTSGFLEVFIKTRISEYSKGKVPKEINRFLTTKFKDITNLKSTKLVDVLESFSDEWAMKLRDYLNEHEQEKLSMDSLVNQRHLIVHGKSANIGSRTMLQYYEDVKNIVQYIDGIIR